MLPPITPKELSYQFKHYNDDQAPQLLGAIIALVTCATIATALRFWARHISGAKLKADDWTILVSTLCIWGLAVIGVISVRDGLGKHAVRVGLSGVLKFLKSEYIFEQVYTIGVSMTKISILLFYLRLFRGKRFKRCVYAVGVFVVLWAITTMIPAIFQCRPVNYFWNRRLDGKCIDSVALILSTAVTNMLTDFIIWLMPFPLVWKLHLPVKQRIALCGIFLLGGFVCIAGVVRLRFLVFVSNTVDPTWVNASGGLWSNIEPSIGVVCANLPILRPLFKNYIANPMRSFGSSSISEKYQKYAPWSSSKSSPKSNDTPMTASTTWVSQGTTQVSTGQRSTYWKSPELSSTDDHKSHSHPRQVMWGGRIFRPHKDSRFADASKASALDSRGDITIDEQEADIVPAHGIRVRRDVEWSSIDKPLPPLPYPEKAWVPPRKAKALTFDEMIKMTP